MHNNQHGGDICAEKIGGVANLRLEGIKGKKRSESRSSSGTVTGRERTTKQGHIADPRK